MQTNIFIDEAIQQHNLSLPSIQSYLKPSYSQLYEDIIVESILLSLVKQHHINISLLNYLEIGANHSINTSNTYFFYEKYGMTGLLIEPNPLLYDELVRFRTKDKILNKAIVCEDKNSVFFYISDKHEISSLDSRFIHSWQNGAAGISRSIKVSAMRINDALCMLPNQIGLLSIDVEGKDYDILKDADFSTYRPLIVVVEPSDFYIQNNSNQIIELMNDNNYVLTNATEVNLIFTDHNMI